MNPFSQSHAVRVTVAITWLALLATTALLFGSIGWVGRITLVASVVGFLVALTVLEGRSFFRTRWSATTFLVTIGALCSIAATNFSARFVTPSGAQLLFFGVLPLVSAVGGLWAFVKFLRYRSLQFAVESICCMLLLAVVLWVGAQL